MTLPASTWGISLQVRKALARFVLESRTDLEDDFRRQLAALGVYANRWHEVGRSLSPEDQAAREAARAVIDRIVEGGQSREEAFAMFVRDSAFTFLNRLVGLRCLEERGMLLVGGKVETAIRRDIRLAASSLYFRVRNELVAEASPRDVWRETLHRAFQAVSERVGLLFDPESEYGRLLPLQPTLARMVDGLNDQTIASETWADDEVLGWVYQYYNSAEKNAVYDKLGKGGKIQQPEELAAATCLYTERYMVDFLLQNTLGALWLQMCPQSRLREGWAYFVAPPDGELRGPEDNIPRRLRELTLLDPACGSGHFLARAFDLLAQMYQEEGIESREMVPGLIIEHNLHGIDIDLRAVQISALRLYLKGCELVGPDFRPHGLNLVSADVVLPGVAAQDLLERFRDDHDVRDLVKAMWSDLKDAPKLGSLLHPERHVDQLLARRRRKGDTLEYQNDEAWERFKLELLDGVRTQFEREAQSADIGRRLFGQNLAKGFGLVEALTRRYDIVVTNPPYAGSTNLDGPVKSFIEREYKDGRRDLYAAFILRDIEFARPGGFVGMVAQQSWLFQRAYTKLRQRVLSGTTVTTLAHLGPRSFEEIGGEVVNVALFTLRCLAPAPHHQVSAFRLIGAKSPAGKARLLRAGLGGDAPSVVFTPEQADIQSIPETPFAYWLRPRFFELLRTSSSIGSHFPVKWGISSSDNDRFLRLFWEVLPSSTWLNHAKGGGFGRWRGMERWVLDWRANGQPVKDWILSRYPYLGRNYEIKIRDHTFFKWGWCYSSMAGQGLGFRLIDPSWTTNAKAPAVLVGEGPHYATGALLNGRVTTYLVRSLMTSVNVDEGYVAALPIPSDSPAILARLGEACVAAKAVIVSRDLTERAFNPTVFLWGHKRRTPPTALLATLRTGLLIADEVATILHTLEGWNESVVSEAYRLSREDIAAVIEETGMPAGWQPLLDGYDGPPRTGEDLELPDGVTEYLKTLGRKALDSSRLTDLGKQVAAMYHGNGSGKARHPEIADSDNEGGDELGEKIAMPPETIMEELSQKFQLHPISIHRLLEEQKDSSPLSTSSRFREVAEDWMSVALLLSLGFRWPDQDTYEAEQAPAITPELVNPDGIIPLTRCGDQPTAAERIRMLLEKNLAEDDASRSMDEFRMLAGRAVGDWMEHDFFRRHIQQFKQRPVAWHLSSSGGSFQTFVLYHRMSRDTLRRLRDVYAGGLLNRLKAELERALARKEPRTAEELRFQIEDVDGFRDRVLAIEEGRELRNRIRCRWKGEDKEGRPGPYAPDISDGVKVNIRPFQETGLLAREVIKKW